MVVNGLLYSNIPPTVLQHFKTSFMDAFNIYPELQSWRKNKQGLSSIVLIIDLNGKHIARDPINHKIAVAFWDNDTKRVKSKYPNAMLINSIIENKINRHNNFILKRQAFNLPMNKEVFVQYVNNSSTFESFYTYAETVIETKKLKDGKGYDTDTKRRYRDEIKRMMQFKPELSFHQITLQYLNQYKQWLQNEYLKEDATPLHKNSIWKALGFIRMVYNCAIKDEVILPDSNPFKRFSVGSYEQDIKKIKFIDTKDMDRLEEVLKTDDSLPDITKKIGWRFLCMCVTGMRISDAMRLDEYFFNDNGDLQFNPHKTRRHGNTATLPITWDRQRRYLEISMQHKFTNTNPKTFRTTFNDNLKVLAALAKIKINLTSHVGRHSMGSFLVDANVDTLPAMQMLGVKSKNVIKTYMHLKQEKLKSEAEKLSGLK
jgi:integrase/recombinase XerD